MCFLGANIADQHRRSRMDPMLYPAPNEHRIARSFGVRSALYLWNAIIEPAEEVLAYSSKIVGDSSGFGALPNTFRAIRSFIFWLA